MSSPAAITWAVLSLEWCAFLTEGVQEEDYKTAEKRQRKSEAMRCWKVYLVVASVPFFLHVSLFLFLTGLWLRLRDMNRQLGLTVGILGLIIALSYAIVILLPILAEAPFFTSVSEMVYPLVNEIRYFLRLRNFFHAPPIFTWISRTLASTSSRFFLRLAPVYHRCPHSSLRVAATLWIHSLQYIYKIASSLAYATWTVATSISHAIFPGFRPSRDPFKELSRLQIGSSDRDKGVHQRALFWLMNSPPTQSEVEEVLKEFTDVRGLGNAEEPLDRGIVKLLVLSLSSVLENGRITEDEQPISDHCTRFLAEEMDLTFREAKCDPRILVRNAAISNGLRGISNLTPPPHCYGHLGMRTTISGIRWFNCCGFPLPGNKLVLLSSESDRTYGR